LNAEIAHRYEEGKNIYKKTSKKIKIKNRVVYHKTMPVFYVLRFYFHLHNNNRFIKENT